MAAHEDRYLRQVLRAARSLHSNDSFVVLHGEDDTTPYEGWDTVAVTGGGGLLGRGGAASALSRAVKKHRLDALLSPLRQASPTAPAPQVLFALDLAPWEKRDSGPNGKAAPKTKAMRRLCMSARAIVVPSEHLRRRCLELFEVPLDRSIVAPVGVDPVFDSSQAPMIEPPYLLLLSDPVSAAAVYRIVELLVKRAKDFPFTLVVAGPGGGPEPSHWGPGVVRIEHCPDSSLAGLHQHAAFSLHPGRYDGSAMRTSEALRAGACVIAPHNRATEELVGEAPFYYNPESSASFIQTVRRVLGLEEEERAERIRLGKYATRTMTWNKTTWKLLSAFKRV